MLLRESFAGSSRQFRAALVDAIRSGGTPLVEVDGAQLAARLDQEKGPGTILALPDARYFPLDAKPNLDAFLKRGNHLLCVSGPAFEHMVVRAGGKWLTREQTKTELPNAPGEPIIDFAREDMSKWRRISGNMANRTDFMVEASGEPRVPDALRARVSKLETYDVLLSPNLSKPFPEGFTALAFWAKGGPQTAQLIVEWREKDESRWMGIVDLSTKWCRYALTPEDFIYWSDNPSIGRGKEGDRFNPADAVAVSFGPANGISKQKLGIDHEFWVAGVTAVKDEFAGRDFSPPVLETLSPVYKTHRTRAFRFEPADLEADPSGIDVVAPVPKARGLGSDALRETRFIPIVRALDKDGETRGAAAHLFINTKTAYSGSVWGCIGLGQDYLDRNASKGAELAVSMLRRIANGVFLANAGVDQFAYIDGETIQTGAFVENLGPASSRQVSIPGGMGGTVSAKLLFEVVSGPVVVKSFSRAVHIEPIEAGKPQEVRGEQFKLAPGLYSARVRLSADGKLVDEIAYEFRVVKLTPLNDANTVTVRDGEFRLGGKRWFGIGVNYWPRDVTGTESWVPWLAAQRYDPEIIEQDLALAQRLGMTLLSIQYTGGAQARGLIDFLARAEQHGIKVHAYLPGLHPLDFSPNEARPLIDQAHLGQMPAFFAYDLGWEVHIGDYNARKQFDKLWQHWVIDRYGSIESAEHDWGYKPERADGTITGPRDDQLTKDGGPAGAESPAGAGFEIPPQQDRVFVAAYRRFWDDEISRRYRAVREFIKGIDPHHLIGARSGYGGTGSQWVVPLFPFDLASGAKHLDYISPEGHSLSGDRLGFLKGGFITAYSRFVSGGKPVFWAEYGTSIWPQCDAERIEGQRQYYENLLDMTYRSNSDGSAAWWWPGGYRLDEKSDLGIVNPDGTPRPAALEIQKLAKKLARHPETPQPDTFFTIDRDKHISGFAGLWAEHADAYVKAIESGKTPALKTEATGKTSADVPLTAVGDRPFNGHNPPEYLNAEFNWIKINGQTASDDGAIEVERGKPVYVEASIGNTGEAKWLCSTSASPGTVCLRIQPLNQVQGQGDPMLAPIAADVAFLADASVPRFEIARSAGGEVTYAFGMVAKDRAEFGEIVRVTVRAK